MTPSPPPTPGSPAPLSAVPRGAWSAVAALPGRVVRVLLLALIAFYRAALSPLLGARCRFLPSCSEYAAECIRHYGALRGSGRAVLRLCRCHPFHPGGYDPPVPEK